MMFMYDIVPLYMHGMVCVCVCVCDVGVCVCVWVWMWEWGGGEAQFLLFFFVMWCDEVSPLSALPTHTPSAYSNSPRLFLPRPILHICESGYMLELMDVFLVFGDTWCTWRVGFGRREERDACV
jgi:hypothetical protein